MNAQVSPSDGPPARPHGHRPRDLWPGAARRRLALAGALAAMASVPSMLMVGPAWARQGGDEQRALEARDGGRTLPLDRLIQQVRALLPGRLLEAELDEDDGRLVYELRWQLPDGRRLEIELDAADGRWLKLKGARLESAFRRGPGGGR